MNDISLLSYVIFLPLLGAVVIMLMGSDNNEKNIKYCALWTSIFNFILSVSLFSDFNNLHVGYQFEEKIEWIKELGIYYHVGIDGISLFFVLLTTLLVPICILASWNSIKIRIKEFMIIFLVMETVMIGVFSSVDIVLFYLFFEASLIPMYLIIGIWGAENRVYAAFKFFLYTLLGSVLFLLAIIYVQGQFNTTDMVILTEKMPELSLDVQKILWIAFFASFAVKVPMWPFHTWLPDAHVQAPTAGSAILAGILLKMGGYGFIRFSLPMLPDASHYFAEFMQILSVIAIIYTSIVAFAQTDMKKLIAYSSVAHMGFVTIGTFSFNMQAVEGAMVQMISHGLVSAALFLIVGVLYEQTHTKKISDYGGVVEKMPKLAFIFMFFMLASVGLPGTSGFVGEFLVIVGTYQSDKLYAILTATGVVLGAIYMLWLYARVVFGNVNGDYVAKLIDLDRREFIYFLPLIILTLWIGIHSTFLTSKMHVPIANIINSLQQSIER
jgi:NADH-quinone oxidoreductase subunit M